MSKVTNTTKQVQEDPEGAFREASVLGTTAFIEGQEARGQRELVASAVLPSEGRLSAELTELGFKFGEPLSDDPLFCEATLPAGWKKVASDHAMWSYIEDERGLRRVQVFYKAAYYDRQATIGVMNVGYDLAVHAVYGEAEIPWHLLTASEREAVVRELHHYAEQARQHANVYGKYLPVVVRLLAEAVRESKR